MSETTRVCDHCGAPLRGLVDGYCPYCRTRPFAVAPVPAPGAPGPALHSVVLLEAGRNKIAVIKELRDIVDREFRVELGLADAKDLVDRADPGSPPALIVDVDPARAQQWAAAFAGVGAVVEIRPPLGAAPVGPAPVPKLAATGTFAVHLTNVGRKKINVIKAVREITGAGLAEAKDVVDAADHAPQLVVAGLDEATATTHARHLADAGATSEVRPG